MISATSSKLIIQITFTTKKFFLAFLLNLQLMTSQRSDLNYAPKPNLSLECLSVVDLLSKCQTKVLTEGGDLREAQVDIPLSVIHSCV